MGSLPSTAADRRQLLATAGFGSRSNLYERGRPDYNPAILDLLAEHGALSPTAMVADIAAGTGKFTRMLSERTDFCVAVEPSAAMGAVFAEVLPEIPLLAASAESLALRTASMHLLTVAQAFHWFDHAVALAELARCLAPGGYLMLVWNERDHGKVPWVDEVDEVTQWHVRRPYAVDSNFAGYVDACGYFEPCQHFAFTHESTLDRQGVVDMVASRSYVNVLPDAERDAMLAAVADIAARLEEPIIVPYVTDLYLARRRSQP